MGRALPKRRRRYRWLFVALDRAFLLTTQAEFAPYSRSSLSFRSPRRVPLTIVSRYADYLFLFDPRRNFRKRPGV